MADVRVSLQRFGEVLEVEIIFNDKGSKVRTVLISNLRLRFLSHFANFRVDERSSVRQHFSLVSVPLNVVNCHLNLILNQAQSF